MRFFIFHDEYYFITNIFHTLKFTDVCCSVFLIDFFNFKSNPIYFKQTKIIQDACDVYTYTKETKCKNVVFVITIFWGRSVLLF
jgi:hypothetical protein